MTENQYHIWQTFAIAEFNQSLLFLSNKNIISCYSLAKIKRDLFIANVCKLFYSYLFFTTNFSPNETFKSALLFHSLSCPTVTLFSRAIL